MEDRNKIKMPHTLILENKKSLSITGVSDVDSFDDSMVVAYTDYGELTVKGEKLHISKLSVETGELNIEGVVSSLVYTDNLPKRTGFLTKLLK